MTIKGGCFCGRIRYEVEKSEKPACYCHCESCQRAAGAPVIAWATFRKDTLDVIEGKFAWYSSSPGVRRGYCAACGTSLSYEHEDDVGYIDLTLNSFDDPTAMKPIAHIWVENKQPWLVINDDLPQYQQTVTKNNG